jgi:hypothetical protein
MLTDKPTGWRLLGRPWCTSERNKSHDSFQDKDYWRALVNA